MNKVISTSTRRRLDIQGFTDVGDDVLAEVGPWLRLAFGLCTLLALLGTALASAKILWSLVPIAALGAIFPVHPFDLIYNFGIRRITNTRTLPKRAAPNRFACGLGAVWLLATGFLFQSGLTIAGYVLGGMLCVVGLLVSTIDFCIPSLIYRSIFGFPPITKKAKA
ncbi:MAG: DUF4395 family protein [Gammaproteobacteria bacterium]|nr:DUF4395 family protein [Gammaproteobacteria bacterium]NIW96815.1 DUF4395 family protein [Phycisphaerae bacterium]